MKAEWVERMRDQARTEMGYCVQDGRIWCSRHDSGKVPGEESCNKMNEGYRIAESAGEVMGDLIADAIEAHYTPPNGDVGPTDYDEGLHTAALLARGSCGFVNCTACARLSGAS